KQIEMDPTRLSRRSSRTPALPLAEIRSSGEKAPVTRPPVDDPGSILSPLEPGERIIWEGGTRALPTLAFFSRHFVLVSVFLVMLVSAAISLRSTIGLRSRVPGLATGHAVIVDGFREVRLNDTELVLVAASTFNVVLWGVHLVFALG